MNNIFHIGDSISLGQYSYLKDHFGDCYSRFSVNKDKIIVHENNCKSSNDHLEDQFLELVPKSSIILQNAGIWDSQGDPPRTPIETYVENLKKIVQIYSKMCDTYVWIHTTPVLGSNTHKMCKKTCDEYRDAEIETMKSQNVMVFEYDVSKCKYIDGVHFKEKSYKLLASQLITFLESL